MKALSIKQPWAALIAAGFKTMECRSWKTAYRGPLLICASKGDWMMEDGRIMPGGVMSCVVNLANICRMKEEYLENAMILHKDAKNVLKGYAWKLELLYPVLPMPVKGRLNIFDVPDNSICRAPGIFLDNVELFRNDVMRKSNLDISDEELDAIYDETFFRLHPEYT